MFPRGKADFGTLRSIRHFGLKAAIRRMWWSRPLSGKTLDQQDLRADGGLVEQILDMLVIEPDTPV